MDDLFAAIAAHLRRHNRRLLTPCPPPVPLAGKEAIIAGIWGDARPQVYCRYCGRPIWSGEGLFEVDKLWEDRSCVDHYVPC